jgi:plastocyanin
MRLGSLLAALLSLAPAGLARAGDVVGEVLFKGAPPAAAALKVNKDEKVCGATVEDQTVVVENGHLENVVVTVKGAGAPAPAPEAAKVVLDQQLCHYVPHVQAVGVGSTLEIVNSDPMLHNIHGRVGSATAFNLAMPVKGMRVPRVLSKPELIHVQCDVHNFMNGWVVVTDGPFAVVGKDGRFAIKGLPAGTYTVTAWHEKYGEKTAQVTVPASGEAKADFSYSG